VTIDKLRREFDRKKRATEFVKNSPLDIADRIIAELEDKVEELDDKLMEAEGAHDAARRWFEEQKQFARARKAEAERDQALFVADGWHRQFKHAAKAWREEKARAKKAEAEARRWEWVAKEASCGRRTPDGPLLDTLLARYEEEGHWTA
jgi:hypothetical protein